MTEQLHLKDKSMLMVNDVCTSCELALKRIKIVLRKWLCCPSCLCSRCIIRRYVKPYVYFYFIRQTQDTWISGVRQSVVSVYLLKVVHLSFVHKATEDVPQITSW